MEETTLHRIFLFGFWILHLSVDADANSLPIFKVVSSRSSLEPPSVEVVFPNGVQDDLALEHYKLFKGSKGGHSYIGYLKNDSNSSVALTGNLAEPGDRMEITLISQHTADQMFQIDYFGKTTTIPTIPEEFIRKENLMALNPKERKIEDRKFALEEGDEEVDEETQDEVYSTAVVSMPSKLKMVMKIGYTEGLVKQLEGISCGGHYAASCSDCPQGHGASWCTCKLHHKHCDCIWKNDECVRKDEKQKQSKLVEWPKYIEKVMAHAQAIFFDPTLGTKIQLEVQEGFLYNPSTTWTSGSHSEARQLQMMQS